LELVQSLIFGWGLEKRGKMKRLIAIILFSVICTTASAQLYGNKWRFGVSMGVTNYLGDIRPLKVNNFGNFTRLYKRYDNYSEQLSYQVSMEYSLGKSVGIMLTVGTYQFGAGDRFVQNDGNLFVEGLNFERALTSKLTSMIPDYPSLLKLTMTGF